MTTKNFMQTIVCEPMSVGINGIEQNSNLEVSHLRSCETGITEHAGKPKQMLNFWITPTLYVR